VTIITGVIGLLSRFAGRLLSTTLGWATLLLFGKVPQSRQTLLLVIVFGSLVWVALVIGVLVPQVGVLLIAAVPLPEFVDETWIRLAMLIGAVILPLLIGVGAALVSKEAERTPRALIVAGLRGYPFAAALAVILVILAAYGVYRKIGTLRRRWEDAHVPIMVKPRGYETVLREVDETLSAAVGDVVPRDAGTLLSGPPRVLDKIAGRGLGDMVPDRLMILAGEGIEVLVYPSDLAISGTRERVARARAALASHVPNAPAYLTTSAEAQELEDVLDRIRDDARHEAAAVTLRRLAELDERLAALPVEYDEWEVLYRLRLQLERDARRALAGDRGADFIDHSQPHAGRGPSPVGLAFGIAGTALLALDVALLLASRRHGRRRH
jgi:hypothetical protein